jgi:uncharacterized membrane protein YgcG
MSPHDVPPDEMGMDPNATDDALERTLSGQAPADDEWRDVALFVEELQEAVPTSDLASEDLHVAAMVETAHLLADKGDPVVRPVSNAAAPAPQVSGLPKQKREPMKPMKRSTRNLVRVLAPIAAVLTVFSGMAYAGALPHQVQKAVSTAASTVGINLPGDDETEGDDNDAHVDENDQGDDTQGDTTQNDNPGDTTENDNQGDENDQGEDTQGDTTQNDNSGDTTENDNQGDENDQGEDTQGVSSGPTSGGDQSQNDDNQGDDNHQGEDSHSGSSDGGGGSSDGGGDSQGDSQD